MVSKDTIVVSVVSDALILQKGFADGRGLPLIIIDTTGYPQVERSIELHRNASQGEVSYVWGKTTNGKHIILRISMISPVEIEFIVLFDLHKHYELINLIIKSHLLYIQAGKPGDRLIHDMAKPKLFLEIGSTDFDNKWESIYRKSQRNRFVSLGVKKKDLDAVIKDFNNEWASFSKKRFK